MRTVTVLLLLALPLLAREQSIADRFPAGATACLETHQLAGNVDKLLDSGIGRALRNHPVIKAFLASPEGRKLLFGQAMLQGATGRDFLGNLRALASRDFAVALYGKPERFLLLARVDPQQISSLLSGIETLSQQERKQVLPAGEGRAALWSIGPVFVMLDEDLLAVSPDRLLMESVRLHEASGLSSIPMYRDARQRVSPTAAFFAYVDLQPFRDRMRKGGLPENFGAALFGGALSFRVRNAPWAAFGVDLKRRAGGWTVDVNACIPRDPHESAVVEESFGGTLPELPFALSGETLGVLRVRRDLASIWSNRDALIAERGVPGMIEFETNFGNLTAGTSWVEEFLPNLGEEMILIGMRPHWAPGEPVPSLKLPAGAMVFPLRDASALERTARVTFYNLVGILNASQQGMMQGVSLLPAAETYKGVRIETARYAPPEDAGHGPVHVRYNFSPSLAVIDGNLVIASSESIVRMLIDGRGKSTPTSGGINAEFRIVPRVARAMLAENRGQLIAQTMLRQGVGRTEAEHRIDLALDLARYLRDFDLSVEETRSSYGLRLRVSLGRPAE